MSVPDSTPPQGMDTFETIINENTDVTWITVYREFAVKLMVYIRYLEAKAKTEAGSFY